MNIGASEVYCNIGPIIIKAHLQFAIISQNVFFQLRCMRQKARLYGIYQSNNLANLSIYLSNNLANILMSEEKFPYETDL